MKNSRNKRTTILVIILLGLLVIGYKVMFVPPSENSLLDENTVASERMENILQEIENISFDIGVINDKKFKSLKSIETPLVSLPVGKRNPFSAILNSN